MEVTQMNYRKSALTLYLVCLMFALLTGSAFAEKVQIKAVIWGGESELEVEQEIVEEFNQLYPDIELTVESYAGYDDKILVETAGGVGPDIMLLDSISVPFWMEKDVLIDLTPYLAEEDSDFLEQFFPNVVDAGRIGDKFYALPKDFTPQVLYYNRRAFDLSGITEPQPGWTWDEFMEKAPKLTSDEPRRERRAVYFDDWIYRWVNWIWSLGGEVLAWEDGQLKADGYLNSMETIEAFAEYIGLRNDRSVAIAWRDIGVLGVEPLLSGRCALWGSGHWWLQSLRRLRAFKPEEIRVVGYPVRDERANLMAESGFAMTVNTKNPEEAWEAIKFLTGPFAQEKRAESGLAVSANIAVAQEFAYADPIEEGFLLEVPFMKVHVIEHPDSDRISDIIDTAVRSAIYDGKALGPTLEIATEQVEMVLKENPWSPFQ
jgi:multiple sugar transport system substrate-binding protein